MGLNMKEKQAVTREYRPRYQKAGKKEKRTLPDEYTKLTGYHLKSAVRVLGAKPVKQVTVYRNGKAVKDQTWEKEALKPNREAHLRRRGHLLPAAGPDVFLVQMREDTRPADAVYGRVAGLLYHGGNCGKTKKNKPRGHRPLSEKRQGRYEAEREKPHKTVEFHEKPRTDPHVLHPGRAGKTGFPAN